MAHRLKSGLGDQILIQKLLNEIADGSRAVIRHIDQFRPADGAQMGNYVQNQQAFEGMAVVGHGIPPPRGRILSYSTTVGADLQ